LNGEAAILVEPTPAGLASGILQAFEDPAGAAALGRRAQRLVQERYTYTGFKRGIAECYAAVLGPGQDASAQADEAGRSGRG
jgi:hypothetical protein